MCYFFFLLCCLRSTCCFSLKCIVLPTHTISVFTTSEGADEPTHTSSLARALASRISMDAEEGSDRKGRVYVYAEIFDRILFSRIALKDIFATLKVRD